MRNLSPHCKRLARIIWHGFDVPWYWQQVRYEIKMRRTDGEQENCKGNDN